MSIRREVFGERSAPVGTALGRVAYLRFRTGDLAGAEEQARMGLEIQRETLQAGHREFMFTLRPLGLTLAKAGRAAEAGPVLTEALALARKHSPNEPRLIAELEAALAGR